MLLLCTNYVLPANGTTRTPNMSVNCIIPMKEKKNNKKKKTISSKIQICVNWTQQFELLQSTCAAIRGMACDGMGHGTLRDEEKPFRFHKMQIKIIIY